MVDSNDHERLVNPEPENKYGVYADSGLQLLLEEDELKDAVVLIFANKQVSCVRQYVSPNMNRTIGHHRTFRIA